MSMEEWTGFELSEQVLDEATRWIAALDDIDDDLALSEVRVGEHLKNYDEHKQGPQSAQVPSIQSSVQHALQRQQDQYALLAEFNEWLNAHTQHQQAYAEMSLLWAKSICIHEISDRICASNVLAFSQSDQHPDENDFATVASAFKRKRLSILLPHNQELSVDSNAALASSPAWAYVVSMGLIALGLSSPFLNQLLF